MLTGPAPHEKVFFDRIFDQADQHHRGVIYGKEAVDMLSRSGLPKPVLRQVRVNILSLHGRGLFPHHAGLLLLLLMMMMILCRVRSGPCVTRGEGVL